MLAALKNLPEDCSYATFKSPVGELYLIASDRGLHALLFELEMKNKDCRDLFAAMEKKAKHPVLAKALAQLAEYFRGERREFDLPLVPFGTDFQKQAWRELSRIPYGETISYREQAARVGDAKKARAVGTANSRNPLAIVVPCHRVIAQSGALSGFGGGVSTKKFLLELENRQGSLL